MSWKRDFEGISAALLPGLFKDKLTECDMTLPFKSFLHSGRDQEDSSPLTWVHLPFPALITDVTGVCAGGGWDTGHCGLREIDCLLNGQGQLVIAEVSGNEGCAVQVGA